MFTEFFRPVMEPAWDLAGYLARKAVFFKENGINKKSDDVKTAVNKLYLSGTRFALACGDEPGPDNGAAGIINKSGWIFGYCFARMALLPDLLQNNYPAKILEFFVEEVRKSPFKNPAKVINDSLKMFEDNFKDLMISFVLSEGKYLFAFRGAGSSLYFTIENGNWIFSSEEIGGLKWEAVQEGSFVAVDYSSDYVDMFAGKEPFARKYLYR
jgi:hypothetical protein